VAADAAEGLYRLVDAAYEKRSVAVSSNLHPAAFDELMPKTLATVLLRSLRASGTCTGAWNRQCWNGSFAETVTPVTYVAAHGVLGAAHEVSGRWA
jgi:hypothetical protein